jgi:predicted TPR repeat methyltransferase
MNRQERRARQSKQAKAAAHSLSQAAATAGDPERILAHCQDLFRLGKVQDAKPLLAAAITRHPGHPGLGAAHAYALAATGEFSEAITAYSHLADLQPENAALRTNLAALLMRTGRRDDAKTQLEAALRLAPGHANTLYTYAELVAADDREDAFRHYRRAVAVWRKTIGKAARIDHCHDLVKLANAEVWTGDLAAAMTHYDAAIALRPDYALAHARRGLALAKLRRAPEAIQSLKRAAALEPDFAEAERAIGELLMDSGDLEGASRHFEAATRINPQDVLAHYFFAATGKAATPAAAPPAYVQNLFDEYAATFDHHLVDVLRYRAHELVCDAVLDIVGHAGPAMAVIDLGCGTGLCGPLIKPIAAMLIGVDIAEKMLDKARERGVYDALVHADLLSGLEPFEAALDIALSTDVFVYVGNLEPAFRATRRALKPDGLFAFTVETGGEGFTLDTTGRYLHAPSYVRALADAQGFQVLRCEDVVTRYQSNRPVQSNLWIMKRGA